MCSQDSSLQESDWHSRAQEMRFCQEHLSERCTTRCHSCKTTFANGTVVFLFSRRPLNSRWDAIFREESPTHIVYAGADMDRYQHGTDDTGMMLHACIRAHTYACICCTHTHTHARTLVHKHACTCSVQAGPSKGFVLQLRGSASAA